MSINKVCEGCVSQMLCKFKEDAEKNQEWAMGCRFKTASGFFLKKIPTAELSRELSSRDGVSFLSVTYEEKAMISKNEDKEGVPVQGPAIILINQD